MSRPLKPRLPDTYADPAVNAAALAHNDNCAAAIGKSPALFRKAMDPDSDSTLSLPQAEAVDRMLVAAGHEPVFAPVLTVRVGRPAAPAMIPVIMVRLSAVFEDAGNLSGEVRAAVCPTSPGGRGLSRTECVAISGRAAELRDELDALMQDMEARLERMNTHDGAASLKRAG